MDDIMARTTNYAKATYTEIIDLQTVNGKCSIIGIHTPTGAGPYMKLRGFFNQFRKFKYVGIDRMIMCPAANLPVDPLGLTDVPGTTGLMDPRDTLNPILFHGCHGETMDAVINGLFAKHNSASIAGGGFQNPSVGFESQSADLGEYPFGVDTALGTVSYAEQSYYRFLTDPKWRKFGSQSMVNISKLHPLTWKVASSTPYLPVADVAVGSIGNPGRNDAVTVDGDSSANGTIPYNLLPNYYDIPTGDQFIGGAHRAFSQQFTNGVSRLGWLPTVVATPSPYGAVPNYEITRLPKLFMGCLILPPAYNVEQFFRLSIRHTFLFKDFTQSLLPIAGASVGGAPEASAEFNQLANQSYFNWIDYADEGSKKVVQQSVVDHGTTLDVVDGSSELLSDSAM